MEKRKPTSLWTCAGPRPTRPEAVWITRVGLSWTKSGMHAYVLEHDVLAIKYVYGS